MASWFTSQKYQKCAINDNDFDRVESKYDNVKMGYQYTNAPFSNITRSNRSDSSGSYSSVSSSDSAYEKLAPSEEELSFDTPVTPKSGRRVRFQLEKDLPAL
jgi:hypothetical protein